MIDVVNRIGCAPLAGQGKLVASWHGLNDDVMVLDASILDLAKGSLNERVYDGFVPSCVNDCDPQGRPVELFRKERMVFDGITHGCLSVVELVVD